MPPMGKNYLFIFILVYLVIGLVSFVHILKYNFETTSQNKELQNLILDTQLQVKEQELQYLKMQIHPHFLFNTLNTIYGHAIKQSQHTPDLILKLSNLLDYILYQVNKPKVSLKEEIMHIREYIELEKIRFQDSLKVEFYNCDVDPSIQIAPMMLIPFVENAFKHGSVVDGFLRIEINISLKENLLDFSVRNSFLNHDESNHENGIGLKNLRKRLELNYPNNFELNKELKNNWYSVNLSIFDLNSTKTNET